MSGSSENGSSDGSSEAGFPMAETGLPLASFPEDHHPFVSNCLTGEDFADILSIWLDGVDNHRIQGHVGSCYLVLRKDERERLRLVLKLPKRNMKYGLFHDGSVLTPCVIVRIMLPCLFSYHEKEEIAFVELFESTGTNISKEIIDKAEFGRDNYAEMFFPALLGFCTVFDPLCNVLPNIFDALVHAPQTSQLKLFTYWEVENVGVKSARSNFNIRNIRMWLLAVAGGCSFEDAFNNSQSVALPPELPNDLDLPLKIRNMYSHLGGWDNSYRVKLSDEDRDLLRRIFFDLPLLHQWHKQYTFVHLLHAYFYGVNPEVRRNLLKRIPNSFKLEKEIEKVIDVLNDWMFNRQIEYERSGRKSKKYSEYTGKRVIEFFVNLLKHIHEDLVFVRGEESGLIPIYFGCQEQPAYYQFKRPYVLPLPRVYPQQTSFIAEVKSAHTAPSKMRSAPSKIRSAPLKWSVESYIVDAEDADDTTQTIQFGSAEPTRYTVPYVSPFPRRYPRTSTAKKEPTAKKGPTAKKRAPSKVPALFIPSVSKLYTHMHLVRLIEERLDIQGLLHQALCKFLKFNKAFIWEIVQLVVPWHS